MAQTLRSLGMTRLLILGAVGIGLVFFFVFMGQRMSAPNMALLYGNLEPPRLATNLGRAARHDCSHVERVTHTQSHR